ncbi:MAG: HAD family hydrolase [Anaerosomatales bacterium]
MPAPVPSLEIHPLATGALRRASILYTDLDGTLLGPGARLLSDAAGAPSLITAEAVVALNRAGLDCVVCSGRNRWQLMEVSRLLGWDAYIAEVGCVIVPGRGQAPIYYTGSWGPAAMRGGETPYEAIARVGSLRVLQREFPGLIEEHAPWHLNREATHVLRGNVPLADAQAALDTLELPVRIVDNGIINPPRHTLRGVTEVHAYHLIPDGVHKSDAIERDLARRGLGRADALAIGDSATDVEMADAVALGVLVANALDDARVVEAAATRDNVAVTHGERGEGWAELASAWLSARDGDRS